MDSSGQAEVAELADAQASGACASQGRGGSNPPFRTTLERIHSTEFCFWFKTQIRYQRFRRHNH